MKRFVEGTDRGQSTLFPECLEDWIGEGNPVRVIDVFVEELDLADLGFGGVDPEATGRPSYHPSVLLKLYIYGYLNRVQSSRTQPRPTAEVARRRELRYGSYRILDAGSIRLDVHQLHHLDPRLVSSAMSLREISGRARELCVA